MPCTENGINYLELVKFWILKENLQEEPTLLNQHNFQPHSKHVLIAIDKCSSYSSSTKLLCEMIETITENYKQSKYKAVYPSPK